MISNKKGQTLILFIILIPLILGVLAMVVDVGLLVSKNSNLKEVTKIVIRDSLKNDLQEEEIEDLFIENKIDISNLELDIEKDKIKVKNKIEIDSIFGAIIGLKKYTIKIDMIGYKDSNKIVID